MELHGLYRAIAPMGQGGMGRTFRALQLDTQTPCAIKQFYPRSQDPRFYEKALSLFQREAFQLRELGAHPQIPKFLDFFSESNYWYLVQEFINGADLEVLLHSGGPFSEFQIRELLQQMLPVLSFLEQHQVIHRDIKPANILLTGDGRYVLVDFGASKTHNSQLTGTLIGTAEYAAPEQTQGRATYASDIYSLGVTCIHLLTKQSPFDLYDDYRQEWCWLESLPQPISPHLQMVLSRRSPNLRRIVTPTV
ncbi:MAG: serine/threonine protein kinase [Oscillatoriales cyanobacterium SM2_2_1]|nr:serine/threonine protein kinase [Oscillatoriales cyanobacterium SM2_2_1]